jgi:tetratricopeptide (TPR) repeat protein
VLTVTLDAGPQLWDVAAGGPVVGRPLPHQAKVNAVAFRPDGKAVITGTADGTVQVWDTATASPIGAPLKHEDTVNAVAFSPDGRTALTASNDRTARLWDTASGRSIARPLMHPDQVRTAAFSPDGRTVVTGCADASVRLWDAATGEARSAFRDPNGHFQAVIFSPDGKVVLTAGFNTPMRLRDAATGAAIGSDMRTRGALWAAAFSHDGKSVTTAAYLGLQVWDAASGRLIGSIVKDARTLNAAAFSLDGQRILIGGDDTSARLWDAATGRPLGPPLLHQERVFAVALSPDGRTAVTTSDSNEARLWDVSELPDDLPRIECWVQVRTGLTLDEDGQVKPLDHSAWRERRERLAALGGVPEGTEPRWRLDPILFGPDPTARARAWVERKFWAEAEAAYVEVVRARPFNREVRDALARLQVERGHLDRAAATLAEGVRLAPDDSVLRRHLGVALLMPGDRAGWRSSIPAPPGVRPDGTIYWWAANEFAWSCALGPGATADPEVPVRLAEAAVRDCPESNRGTLLNTLGAALYRAGRYDEAIRRLNEGSERRGGASTPDDWPFLAMAHHRLGHQAEARRWLDKLREYRPSASPDRFWDDLTTPVLRSEAEAVILYDPAFPDDAFAHRRPGETPTGSGGEP